MKECVPDVLDVLATIAVPNVKDNSEQQIVPLCTVYGILMFTRWKELSLIQKMNSILLSTGHATERVQCIIILCLTVSVAEFPCNPAFFILNVYNYAVCSLCRVG